MVPGVTRPPRIPLVLIFALTKPFGLFLLLGGVFPKLDRGLFFLSSRSISCREQRPNPLPSSSERGRERIAVSASAPLLGAIRRPVGEGGQGVRTPAPRAAPWLLVISRTRIFEPSLLPAGTVGDGSAGRAGAQPPQTVRRMELAGGFPLKWVCGIRTWGGPRGDGSRKDTERNVSWGREGLSLRFALHPFGGV